jgi:hypothetical protein
MVFAPDGNENILKKNCIFSWQKTTTARSSFYALEKRNLLKNVEV